jgi:hypothetical protein
VPGAGGRCSSRGSAVPAPVRPSSSTVAGSPRKSPYACAAACRPSPSSGASRGVTRTVTPHAVAVRPHEPATTPSTRTTPMYGRSRRPTTRPGSVRCLDCVKATRCSSYACTSCTPGPGGGAAASAALHSSRPSTSSRRTSLPSAASARRRSDTRRLDHQARSGTVAGPWARAGSAVSARPSGRRARTRAGPGRRTGRRCAGAGRARRCRAPRRARAASARSRARGRRVQPGVREHLRDLGPRESPLGHGGSTARRAVERTSSSSPSWRRAPPLTAAPAGR